MKHAKFTVEFIRHVLANGTNPTGEHDRFQRASDGKLVFQQSWWHSAFAAALPGSGIRGIKPNHIHMDLMVTAPTQMYRRRYGRGNHRTHEAIMPGTKVLFEALVDDHVTESGLRNVLTRVGRFIGISPYGHKLGFGMYHLVTLEIQHSDPHQPAQEASDG